MPGFGDAVKGEQQSVSAGQDSDPLPSSLPPAPASGAGGGGGGAAASSVAAAGLVMAQLRLGLPAAVAMVVVALVLLVKRYRSRHPAWHPESSSWISSFCLSEFLSLLSAWLMLVFKSRWIECYIIMQCQVLPLPVSKTG